MHDYCIYLIHVSKFTDKHTYMNAGCIGGGGLRLGERTVGRNGDRDLERDRLRLCGERERDLDLDLDLECDLE